MATTLPWRLSATSPAAPSSSPAPTGSAAPPREPRCACSAPRSPAPTATRRRTRRYPSWLRQRLEATISAWHALSLRRACHPKHAIVPAEQIPPKFAAAQVLLRLRNPAYQDGEHRL